MIVPKILLNNAYVPDIPEGLIYESCTLNPGGETYTLSGVTEIKDVPFTITQLQGKLQLRRMGLLSQVQSLIDQAGEEEYIYWEYATEWERTSPILNRLAPMIWPDDTQSKLDNFFTEAKKMS